MKIVVAVKRVPDTATRIQIEPDGRSISTRDVNFILNPYDEIALEQAIRIKENQPRSEVLAVCLGADGCETTLRTALAVGADVALHLKVPGPTGLELDGRQTASVLADALRSRPFDLLLCGRLAVDDQSSQVATQVARRLGMPSVADVIKVEIETEATRARFHHVVEGQVEVVECDLPAVASAQKGLAEVRYPSLKGILAAKKKPIEVVAGVPPEAVLETVSLQPPPQRNPGRIVGKGVEAVPELVRLLRDEAKVVPHGP